jgi:hypothetical protein
MADGEIVERLTVEFDAKVEKILTKLNGLNKTIHGHAASWQGAFEKVNLDKALGHTFDSGFAKILEEGTAKLGVFGKGVEHLGIVGIGAAAGIGAVGMAVEEAAKAAEWAENLEMVAKKIGVTTTALQEFDFMATASGIPVDAFRESLQGLEAKIGQVQAGVAKAQTVKIFQAMDISPEQLRRMGDLQTILPVIAQKLAELPSAERAGLAARLDVTSILPALVKGKEGYADMVAEAHRYGIVVDADVIKRSAEAAEKLKIASDIIDKNMKSAFASLAPAIAGATMELAKFLAAAAKVGQTRSPNSYLSPEARRQWLYGDRSTVDQTEAAYRKSRGLDVTTDDILKALKIDPAVAKLVADKPKHRGGANKPEEMAKAGDDAIAKATDAELRAREALTGNLQQRLDIAIRLLDAETAQKVTALEHDVTLKKINRADADKAEALTRQAAGEQADLLRRDAAFRIEDQEIAIHQAKVDALIAQLTDEADMAATARERRKIEARILEIRQQMARDLEGTHNDRAVKTGAMTADQAAGSYNALIKTQAADTQKSVYQAYYGGVRGALDAAVKGGWPGLAKYMGDKLETNLLDAMANGLTRSLIGGGAGGGGGLFGALIGAAMGVPAFATGTDSAPGGLSLVGERGPELLNLKQGAQVVSNGLLSRLGQSAPASGGGVTLISFDVRGAVMTTDLLDNMTRMANEAQQRATMNGAAIGAQIARTTVPADLRRRSAMQFR